VGLLEVGPPRFGATWNADKYMQASLGNPLFLIKARMQAYSPALPVGAQHYYKNSFNALSTIFRAEGLRGLVRGIDAAILRTSMGSSVQLPSYNLTKNFLVNRGILPANSTWTFLASSSVSGICVVRRICSTPKLANHVRSVW
jgi:solute carrier family 25 protein 34/35